MNSLIGWEKITNLILKNDYCCGCGVCAGICSYGSLQMRFNKHGEYRPYLIGACTSCGLCAKVCPFIDENANEDEISGQLFSEIPNIKHAIESGYYLDVFVGHVIDMTARVNSASGGIATWLLETLLQEKMVDYVICVSANDDPDQMFRYRVCRSAKEVRAGSRSCYYPVNVQDVLSFVAENDGSYAIIGLPCVCKAIRLSQNQSKKLRERIKYVIGLVCGQTKSKFFVAQICALAGGSPHSLKCVQFRVKDSGRPASDYGLKYVCEDKQHGIMDGTIFWSQGMNNVWINRHFTPNACDFCDDIFAECADIALMDAWLPKYRDDWRGHNIVVCRKPEISLLLQKNNRVNIFLEEIPVAAAINSQKGVCRVKRNGLAYRLYVRLLQGKEVPQKRIKPSKATLNVLQRLRADCLRDVSTHSPENWIKSGNSYEQYNLRMKKRMKKIQIIDKLYALAGYPYSILNKIRKLFAGKIRGVGK